MPSQRNLRRHFHDEPRRSAGSADRWSGCSERLFGRLVNFTPLGIISETVPNNFSEHSRVAVSPSVHGLADSRVRRGLAWVSGIGADADRLHHRVLFVC
jgi:hypothetical protein